MPRFGGLQVEASAVVPRSNIADCVRKRAHWRITDHVRKGNAVIGRCFNPECSEELRYLRQGSVYAWESGGAGEFRVEFFWLCPTCSCRYQVDSDEDGRPALSPRTLRIWSGPQGCRVRRVFREVLQENTAAPSEADFKLRVRSSFEDHARRPSGMKDQSHEIPIYSETA